MLTGLVEGKRRTAVWGGLHYRDFGAYAVLNDGSPAFYSEDPVVRLIDEDQTWMAHDTFYLDVHTREPFEALECYGLAMRAANHASPNVYDFPVLCGWSVGALSKLPDVNKSAKLIGDLKSANDCGITKYTKVSLRLEPDKYHFDTEQGWWDDEHMRKFGHLVEPYESIAKWSNAMNAGHGIPYIYMQLGRPCLEVTTGLVDTQRTWLDSKDYEPAMVSISGLRWYKNQTVFNYYPDTKTVHDLSPEVRRSMLTMVILTSGRRDLATSFSLFTPEITRDVSRTYPHYPEARSARPLDAFTGVEDPQVYDLDLTPDWHQLAFYNTGKDRAVVSTAISGERADNAIGLDPSAHYHAYEFWSATYLGKLAGIARIGRELEPNCCSMISVRKALPHPQVICTDRHILQGWVDLADVRWDAETKTLSGTAHVIGGDPFKIIIAHNGARPLKAEATGGACELGAQPSGGLGALTLSASANADVKWALRYE